MKVIENIGSLKQFDKLVSNYLKDGYQISVLYKDTTGIYVKLVHQNGKRINGKFDFLTGSYKLY